MHPPQLDWRVTLLIMAMSQSIVSLHSIILNHNYLSDSQIVVLLVVDTDIISMK